MTPALCEQGVDKEKLQEEVRQALYAAKICSYAQGMNIIKAKSEAMGWGINMGGLARIWKVCRVSGLLEKSKPAVPGPAAHTIPQLSGLPCSFWHGSTVAWLSQARPTAGQLSMSLGSPSQALRQARQCSHLPGLLHHLCPAAKQSEAQACS